MKSSKKFVVGFFVFALILLVSTVLYFTVPQMVIGNQLTASACQSYVRDNWCTSGYACSDCSLQTLPYYLIISGTTTNKVYSSDCVLGSSNTGIGATGLPRTFCSAPSNVVSHNSYQCYGNDIYWFNSVGARESVKSSCSYKCVDTTLTTASCVSAPSCSAQGQSCGSPNLPSCCSGLSCQNFGCYPATSSVPSTPVKVTYCSGSNVLCKDATSTDSSCSSGTPVTCPSGCDIASKSCKSVPVTCSNTCDVKGQSVCTGTNTWKTCSADSSGCLKWVSPFTCQSGKICDSSDNANCVVPPVTNYPVCSADGKMLCSSNAQYFNGEIVGCTGTNCVNGCVNNACVIVPVTCPVSKVCNGNSVLTTNNDCSESSSVCPSGTGCSNGVCVAPATCSVSSACSGLSKVVVTNADCSKTTSSCNSDESCSLGVCNRVVDLCAGVTCNDYCDASFTAFSSGKCGSSDGKCVYSSVVTNSVKCLPTITSNSTVVSNNTGNVITGGVVVDTTVSAPSFISTYGVYIAGGVFLLALLLFVMSFGGKSNRGRK